jgi:hypothetical protein
MKDLPHPCGLKSVIAGHAGWVMFVVCCWLPFSSARADDVFTLDWFTVDGGGVLMSGGDFTLHGTTGQADTGRVTLAAGSQMIKSGFWAFDFTDPGSAVPTLRLQLSGVSDVLLSWHPETPGFSMQQSLTLLPASWSTISAAPENPVVLPRGGTNTFFRLYKP